MIINSLLDQDFYKLSMGQAVLHQFPTAQVEYKFKCRNNIKWNEQQVYEIKNNVEYFATLKFQPNELDYLANIGYFKKDYIDFLKCYQPDISHVSIELVSDELKISIKGPWFLAIYWEVPLLAIISEVYSGKQGNHQLGKDKLDAKLDYLYRRPFALSDFGTRRRYSFCLQDCAVSRFVGNPNFLGTSNVYLAKKYNIKLIGTQAHEWYMAHQAIYPIPIFQKMALQNWVNEYGTDLGIALTDTIGINAFLQDFNKYFATVYSGLRQDSGDPYVWADKVLAHYKKFGIDTKTKTLVFSDGLDFQRAYKLNEEYKNAANCVFGIGTNLTNDAGLIPPNIVIKMTKCNGQSVAKISDSLGKGMCNDDEYLAYLRKMFNVQ